MESYKTGTATFVKCQFQEITGLLSVCSFQKLQHQPSATEGHFLHLSFLRLHLPAIELFEISHDLCLNMSEKGKKNHALFEYFFPNGTGSKKLCLHAL